MKSIITVTILAFMLGSMFASLHSMSTDTGTHSGMTDCPYMIHEGVICTMNLAEHIDAWKAAFLTILPTLIVLLSLAVTTAFSGITSLFLTASHQISIHIDFRVLKERTYSFSSRPLQDLFSNGILHPKLHIT